MISKESCTQSAIEQWIIESLTKTAKSQPTMESKSYLLPLPKSFLDIWNGVLPPPKDKNSQRICEKGHGFLAFQKSRSFWACADITQAQQVLKYNVHTHWYSPSEVETLECQGNCWKYYRDHNLGSGCPHEIPASTKLPVSMLMSTFKISSCTFVKLCSF